MRRTMRTRIALTLCLLSGIPNAAFAANPEENLRALSWLVPRGACPVPAVFDHTEAGPDHDTVLKGRRALQAGGAEAMGFNLAYSKRVRSALKKHRGLLKDVQETARRATWVAQATIRSIPNFTAAEIQEIADASGVADRAALVQLHWKQLDTAKQDQAEVKTFKKCIRSRKALIVPPVRGFYSGIIRGKRPS